MASDWMLQRVQGTATPAQSPPVPTAQPTTQPIQPTDKPIQQPVESTTPKDSWASPQGKLFSGNLIQKAFDIPMLPNYAFSGLQKGALDEKQNQIKSGAVNTKSYGSNIGSRLLAGVKGI